MTLVIALYAALVSAALVLHAHDVIHGMRDTLPRARIVRRRRAG
jgi:hypothetical protein